MNHIWNYLKNLGQRLDKSSASQAYIHESIERSEEELANYDLWKQNLASCELINWLHAQRVQHLIHPDYSNPAVDFLTSSSIEGFVIKFDQRTKLDKKTYPKEELIYFFDLLKERVLGLEYSLYMSDRRTYPRANGIETVERHYLKPRMRVQDFPNQKMNQQFGNITIQLIERNDQVVSLKFNATKYRDHLYQDADPFEELITVLLA